MCYAIAYMVGAAYTEPIAERWRAVSEAYVLDQEGAIFKVARILELMRRDFMDCEDWEHNQAIVQCYIVELLELLGMSALVQECITLFHRALMLECGRVSELSWGGGLTQGAVGWCGHAGVLVTVVCPIVLATADT
jgi:hypothetical protein